MARAQAAAVRRDPDEGLSAARDAALAEAARRFTEKRPKSAALHARAGKVLPGGNTRTVLYHAPFPLRFVKGEGATVTDADGFTYLDLLGEYTAGIYGHSHPRIRAAVAEALEIGLNLGGHNTKEVEFAEAVCARYGLDLVRFTNSGTEANLMALAGARHFTGQARVLGFWGAYHGGVLSFADGGTPANVPFPVLLATYNDVEGTRALLEREGPSLAAAIVEPVWGTGCTPADAAFLQMLREQATKHGFVLIVDEVMSSRLTPQGYAASLGVRGDLMTLGKYIGGGMSFGAFGGRADIMAAFDPSRPKAVPHAGTFNNNILTMTAGHAAMTEIFTPEACLDLNARGDRLKAALEEVFERNQAPMRVTGSGSMLCIHPLAGAVRSPQDAARADKRLRDLLFLELLEAGYYLSPRGFMALNLILTDAECDGLAAAVEAFVQKHRHILAG